MAEWVAACRVDEVALADVVRWDHGGRTFAIFRSPEDEFFATQGLCTHERVHLADGLVSGGIVACPKHEGRFDYRTGAARGRPACVDLRTFPARVESGRVMVLLD